MPSLLAEVVAGWPLGASLAATAVASTLWQGRRRTALNEALHELRRPLQALALAVPDVAPRSRRLDVTLAMATDALDRLDREINGAPLAPARQPLAARTLVEEAAARWRAGAAAAGASLELRWRAADAIVRGDRGDLARALDNLVVNAIEHGGPRIELRATLGVGWLRIAVADSGRPSAGSPRRALPRKLLEQLAGTPRHGHGLRVVRRIATAHGGEFRLRTSASGGEAVLELPLSGRGAHA